MKLTIKAIHLRNFKGQQSLDIEFKDEITSIAGCNGSGKTTLADGISYCLYGKDSKGNTQFGLKTRDAEGNEIPHLEHSVSLDIVLNDNEEHTISRSVKENWTKMRGSNEEYLKGNTIEYLLDGKSMTKGDFDYYINSIAPSSLALLLSTPSMFPTLHWHEQRTKLSKIIGDVTPEDITGGDPAYNELLKQIEIQSLEQYKKHLSYSIRELKKKIDDMPVRIETLNQTLPEKLDWDNIESEIEKKELSVSDICKQITELENGQKDTTNLALRSRIEFSETRLDNIRKSKHNLARELADKYEVELRSAKTHLNETKELADALTSKRHALSTTIERINDALRELNTRLSVVKEEGSMVYNSRFVIPEDITVCPTCGQYLPEEQAKAAVLNAKNDFNLEKERRQRKLLDELNTIKKDIEQANSDKEESIANLRVVDEQNINVAKAIKEAEKALQSIEEPATAAKLLDEDSNYAKIVAELDDMRKKLSEDVHTDNSEVIANLKSSKDVLETTLKELRSKLSAKAQYERVSKILESTHAEWANLNAQLTELEKEEDLAKQYAVRHDNILESRCNALFKITKFHLFKTQVDGTREPYCTATLDGVEYRDLNDASKIAVGLDIIETLSKYYDVFVPITIDNAESVNVLPKTTSQQVRLYVTNNKQLTIL